MRKTRHVLMTAPLALGLLGVVSAASAAGDHTMTAPHEVRWSDGPASIPEGAKAAVLYGDPSKDDLFALRLKLPAGYVLPPHNHPRPEIVTVISGTFHIGMSRTVDRSAARALPTGSFFAFPPGMAHFAFTEEETVIQLNSTGPWTLDYINPEDDPRR